MTRRSSFNGIGALLGGATLVLGLACSPGAEERSGAAVQKSVSSLATGVVVATNKNDNARTGTNTAETVLTPQNVKSGSFGRLYARAVEGNILTQPLYIGGVNIGGVVKNAHRRS